MVRRLRLCGDPPLGPTIVAYMPSTRAKLLDILTYAIRLEPLLYKSRQPFIHGRFTKN